MEGKSIRGQLHGDILVKDFTQLFLRKIEDYLSGESEISEKILENALITINEWADFYLPKIIEAKHNLWLFVSEKNNAILRSFKLFFEKESPLLICKKIIRDEFEANEPFELYLELFGGKNSKLESEISKKVSFALTKFVENNKNDYFLSDFYTIYLRLKMLDFFVNLLLEKNSIREKSQFYHKKKYEKIKSEKINCKISENNLKVAFENVMLENQDLKEQVSKLEKRLFESKKEIENSNFEFRKKMDLIIKTQETTLCELKNVKKKKLENLRNEFELKLILVKKEVCNVLSENKKERKRQRLFFEMTIFDLKAKISEQKKLINTNELKTTVLREFIEARRKEEMQAKTIALDLSIEVKNLKYKLLNSGLEKRSELITPFFGNKSNLELNVKNNLQKLLNNKKQIKKEIFEFKKRFDCRSLCTSTREVDFSGRGELISQITTFKTEEHAEEKKDLIYENESLLGRSVSVSGEYKNQISANFMLEDEISTIRFIKQHKTDKKDFRTSNFLENLRQKTFI